MDIKSPDVVFLGSTFEESDPRVIDGRSGEDGSRGGDAVPNPVANSTLIPATVPISFPSPRDPATEVLQLRVPVPKC